MIGAFWDALFAYMKKAKKNKDETRYKIAREIEDILQDSYDRSQSMKIKISESKKFKRELEIIDGLIIYKDPTDGEEYAEINQYFYATNFDLFRDLYNDAVHTLPNVNERLKRNNAALRREIKALKERLEEYERSDQSDESVEEALPESEG